MGILGSNWKKIKEDQRIKLETMLARKNNGKATLTMFDTKIYRDWMWSDWGLTPGDKIRCIQALSNGTPNQMNKTRGETNMTKRRCIQCKEKVEAKYYNGRPEQSLYCDWSKLSVQSVNRAPTTTTRRENIKV